MTHEINPGIAINRFSDEDQGKLPADSILHFTLPDGSEVRIRIDGDAIEIHGVKGRNGTWNSALSIHPNVTNLVHVRCGS